MAKVLLTYDISGKHVEFKKRLKALKYSDQYYGNQYNNLPNTTMYHANKTAGDARDEATELAGELKINLERCFAVEFDNYGAIRGAAHEE